LQAADSLNKKHGITVFINTTWQEDFFSEDEIESNLKHMIKGNEQKHDNVLHLCNT
jgi:hypothetical protein